METPPMVILAFAGSLRAGSFNKALIRAAKELAPDNVHFEVIDLDGIPPYNQDLEGKMPEKIIEFKDKIRAADALLIATPEYNYSVPGVLKNAIDWASRPPRDNVLVRKPVAIMGASDGMIGTARAQYHLRQCFVGLNMYAVNKPEVLVSYADEKIDENGRLIDEKTKEKISQLVKTLVAWAERLRR